MKKALILAGIVVLLAGGARAQTPVVLPPGKIVVFKAGDNTGVWNISTARVQPCFVQVFDPVANNQAAPLLSIALPTNAPNGIWINAHAGSEGGGISRSVDHQYLALQGYTGDILSPTSSKPSSATNVTRGIGVMDAFGNEEVLYSDLANWFGLPPGVTQNNPTGIATTDGTNFWGTGNVTGTSSEAAGTLFYNANVSPTPIELQNYIQAAAEARIIGGTLYVVVPGSGVYNFLDPQNNDAVVPLPYDPSVSNPVGHIVLTNLFLGWGSQFQNVANFDMNAAGTIAYGADETYGIVKMVNNGGGWQQAPYYFSATNLGTLSQTAGNQGCFGICVDFSGPNPVIYATTMENGTAPPNNAQGNPNQNRLIQIVDTGSAPGTSLVAVTLATAGTTNEVFRGIDFTPDLSPSITSVPGNYSTTNGGSANFAVTAASVYPLTYQWLQNGTNLPGQTGASLQLSSLDLTYNGATYQCVAANQYGSATSSPAAVLSVTATAQAPVITNSATTTTAFVGGTQTFPAIFPAGTQPFTFQWYFGGQALVDGLKYLGSSSNTLTVSNLAVSDSGNYYLVAGNGAGTVSNLVDTLVVKYHAATIASDQPASVTTFAGFSATLTAAELGGTPPLTNQWYKGGVALTDGNEFSGSGTSALTIDPVGASDAGSYTIVVSNGGGSVTSAVAKVTVLVPPAPSFVGYSNQIYFQNFNTLPDPGTNSVNSINNPEDPGSIDGISYSLANPFDFAFPVVNSGYAGGLGLTNGMQGWYGAADTLFAGVDGITRFGAQDGDQTTGGVIDFGPNDGAGVVGTNRALGLLSTGTTGATSFALKLINESTNGLTTINLSFLGELWHNGTGARVMSFGYTLDPTATNFTLTSQSISNAVAVTNLDFSFPTAAAVTTVDGTQSSNQVSLAVTNLPLAATWQPGQALWLIWAINYYGSGSGNGYAIDNLQFSATNIPPVITQGGVVLPPGEIAVFKAGDDTGVWNISTARVQPCFVQVFNTAVANQTTPLVSLALPTNARNGIWINAHAGSEGGGISRSANREYLALQGYTGNILSPTSSKPSSATNVTRGIGLMDAFGNEEVLYSDLANWFGLPPGVTQNNPTGIATTDGTNFWGTGNVTGTSSEAAGTLFYNANVSPTPIELQNYIQAAAEARIINGTLYVVVPGSGVYNFLDPQNNDAVVPLPYDPNAPNPVEHIVLTNLFLGWGSQFQNVANFDMNASGTIAYGADEAYGIVKMVNNGAGWQQAPYYFSATNIGTLGQLAANQGCFGICVDFSGANPVIYATTMENGTAPPNNAQGNPNQNRLVQIVDTGVAPGTSLVAVTLATAGTTNENFRGIDFTPDLRPAITSNPANYSTTNGGSASFSVGAASVEPLSYQWVQNGTNLPGQTGATLQLSGLALSQNGSLYQCLVTNQFGSVISSPAAVLTVTALAQAPVVTNAPGVVAAIVGGATTFQPVFPTGTQPFTFQWYFGGQALVDGLKYYGSASNSLTISNLVSGDSGNYYLVAGNAAGSVSNLADTLTVSYHVATIAAGQPASVTTFAGFSATLMATELGGTPPVTNQWFKGGVALTDGNEFSGSGTSTLTINPVSASDAGSYTIVVSNGGGSVTSSVAKVTVLVPPGPSFVGYSNQVYAQNFNTLPDPGSNSVNSINNPKDPGSINGVAYSLSNPFDFAFPVVNSGYAGGLGLTNGMQGWYGAADTLYPGVDGITRFGAQDGDQTTGGVIDFGPNNGGGITGTNRALGLLSTATTGSTTFALKLINESTNVLNTFDLSFIGELWHNGTGARLMSFGYAMDPTATNFVLTSESISNAVAVPSLDFSFPTALVVTTVDGTQSSNQVNLAVTNLPLAASWQPGEALWLIWSINFYGSGSGNGYAIDNLQFSAENNPNFAQLALPVITSQPQNSTVTNGATASFAVSATSVYPFVYQWQFNNQNITGATNAVLPLGQVDFTFAGSYQAVVSDLFGSVTSVAASLTVLTSAVAPSITLQPVSQTVFAGSNATFTVAAGGTGPFTYQWSAGPILLQDGGEISGSQTATLQITGAQLTDSGSYVAIVTGPGGVTDSAPATLTVINPTSTSSSFIPYSAPAVYTQNFDSLPDPGATTVNTANPVTINGVTYALADPFDFAAPVLSSGTGGLGLSNTMSGWFGLAGLTSKLGASAGDQSTGGVISFGPTNSAATNRALGLLATSTTGPTAFGARFINTGTNTLNQFNLQFTGELWREQPSPKTLSFGYFVDLFGNAAFSTNVTAFLTNLDVNFPTNVFTPEDGTQATNQALVSVTNQAIADWPPGTALWLVWQMTNAAGTSQGLAIDNLSFSASVAPITAPTLSVGVSPQGVVLTWPVGPVAFTLQQSTDLSQPGGGWFDAQEAVSTAGGVNTVVVPAPVVGTIFFFRLTN